MTATSRRVAWYQTDLVFFGLLLLGGWLLWKGFWIATEWRDARWLAERKGFYEHCIKRGGTITENRYDYSCVGLPTPQL